MKIVGAIVPEIFGYFPININIFSTWKRRTKMCDNAVASHIFVVPEYIYHNL